MTTTPHGPGVVWLAERAGTTPEALLRDPSTLADALVGAAKEAAGLAARLVSDDDATRTRAEAEARAVRAHFAPAGGPTPGERLAATVAKALQEAAVRAGERGAEGHARPTGH